MERITIVGMGPIGASIGLALKRAQLRNTEVVGSSGDRQTLMAVSKMGAVDETTGNLRSAVDGARLLILDTPLTDTRDLLEALGPVLEDGCVVTDTSSTKIRVIEWAEQFLPRGIAFVGGNPLVKSSLNSLEDADPDIFRGIDYCIIPAKSANQQAVRTTVDMVEALGAKPLFLDAHEHDSYSTAMAYLPMVVSAAFVTATAGSNGWREMHRLAASEFRELSHLASNDPQDNEVASRANPEALVHWLDRMITELYAYRNQIKDGSEELLDSFIKAWEARARWEANVVVEDEEGDRLPSSGEVIAMGLVGGRMVDRYRQMKGDQEKKKKTWKYLKTS